MGVGGGGGAIFEPKTLPMYLNKEKEKKKKKKGPEFEPTTSGLEIHLAKHYCIAITKYE